MGGTNVQVNRYKYVYASTTIVVVTSSSGDHGRPNFMAIHPDDKEIFQWITKKL